MNASSVVNRGFVSLFFLFFSLLASISHADSNTWRPLEQLYPHELERLDLSGSGPRDPEVPYVPAERYPFSAPYTVEEIAYRSMEFTQHARWSSVIIDAYGSLTSAGYLDQGITVTYKQWLADSRGVRGQIETRPGDTYMRMIHFFTYPPRVAGQQNFWQIKRSDQTFKTRLDMFVYTPGLRRVRRIPQPRRDEALTNNAQSFDSIVGRDAWEFSWQLVGADTLKETVRFPDTRPTITLRRPDGSYYDKPVADIKLMGDDYAHYTESGAVPCFVLQATSKEDWLPGYKEPKLLIWLDQQSFYPLRFEVYDRAGELVLVEERIAWHANPTLGEQGYAKFVSVYFDPRNDLLSYTLHDAPTVLNITAADGDLVFRPDFMRRNWLKSSLRKSQALAESPEQFYLRPRLYPEKFPSLRNVRVSDEVARRMAQQEEAGHLVFDESAQPVAISLSSIDSVGEQGAFSSSPN